MERTHSSSVKVGQHSAEQGNSNIMEDKNIEQHRLERESQTAFFLFRVFGLYLVEWEGSGYNILKGWFIFYYILWFIWPLAGLVIAIYGWYYFDVSSMTSENYFEAEINEIMQTSVFILGAAVIPSLQTYSLKLITESLPKILVGIAHVNQKLGNARKPIQIFKFNRFNRSVKKRSWDWEDTVDGYEAEALPLFFWMPIITMTLSFLAFVFAWTFGFLKVINWYAVQDEWPYFTTQFTYSILPVFTTWFLVVFLEWQGTLYKAFLHKMKGNYTDEAVIRELHVVIDASQELFEAMVGGFMKYICSVNFLVEITSAVFCTLKLLDGFHQIMYLLPLSIGVFHMWIICHEGNMLMSKHEFALESLKRLTRYLEVTREEKGAIDSILILRENLLEFPPQLVTYAGYRVNSGFFIACVGFIVSYAVIASEITDSSTKLNIQEIVDEITRILSNLTSCELERSGL